VNPNTGGLAEPVEPGNNAYNEPGNNAYDEVAIGASLWVDRKAGTLVRLDAPLRGQSP